MINVTLGAGFDKGLIIIISLLLVEFIGLENYGKWGIFYQFVIIGGNILINPQVALYKINSGDKSFIIFDKKKFFLSVLIIAIITLIYFGNPKISLFAFLSVILLFVYQYLNTIYRFIARTSSYTFNTFLRFFIFLFTFIIIQNIIPDSFTALVFAYIVSLLGVLVVRNRHLRNLKFQKLLTKGEYYLLIVYGLTSTLSTGIDKLILEKGGVDLETIGLYTYVLSLAYIPNFVIEVVYKTIQPKIFSSFRKEETFDYKLKEQIKLGQIIIITANIIIPVAFYHFSLVTGIISEDFAANVKISWILISSIIMAIYSLYHYFNMKIIHFNFTGKLSLSIFLLSCFYILLFFPEVNQEINRILALRFIVLTLITLVTIRINRNLN